MYYFYRKSNRGHGICPLYRGCPPFGESVIRGFTVLPTLIYTIQVGITWKQCAELPIRLSNGKTTVINGKVYCGGQAYKNEDKYIVYCYDLSQDKWTTLPPLPVKLFGLDQVNGKLVAVGG